MAIKRTHILPKAKRDARLISHTIYCFVYSTTNKKKNKNENKKQKNQSSTLEKVHFYEARVYFRHIGFRQVEVLHFYRSAIKHE